MNKKHLVIVVSLLLAVPVFASAQEKKTPATGSGETGDATSSMTRHTLTLNGETIPYTATVEPMLLQSEDGKLRAKVFYIAYTKDDVEDKSARPITFAFNGGPGTSSVWLHLGALGPKKVLLDDEGFPLPPPYRLIDNPYSLLDITDLVFIDPVSTGYSRAAEGVEPQEFHGYQEDIESVGEFIRMYIAANERWSSPKFILGESYGTIRASGLARHLQNRSLGMYLNGVVLVSAVLNSLVKDFSPGNDLPYIFFLPGYTATAWYHQKLPADLLARPLPEILSEAREFAKSEYNRALIEGNRLTAAERRATIEKLARFTGLSPDYLDRANLRVNLSRFLKELLRDRRLTVGRVDSRFTGRDADAAGERYEFDPSQSAILGHFATLLNEYMRTELKYSNENIYNMSANVRPWSYGSDDSRTRYSDSVEVLRRTMSENQDLRLFVANGYYDFATPFFATEYAISHLGLNGEFENRVTMAYYESGHMMYIHRQSHAKLKEDLVKFYREAVGEAR